MSKRICMYPGSFDPVTNGHMDIIRRAGALFDEVIVAIMHNPDKTGCFPWEKRAEMLKKACHDLKNVRIVTSTGLTAELAKEMGACTLVRGIRNHQDLDNENAMAQINGMLTENLDTIYFPAAVDKNSISSTFVRQLAGFGADISPFVPNEVREDVISAFQANK